MILFPVFHVQDPFLWGSMHRAPNDVPCSKFLSLVLHTQESFPDVLCTRPLFLTFNVYGPCSWCSLHKTHLLVFHAQDPLFWCSMNNAPFLVFNIEGPFHDVPCIRPLLPYIALIRSFFLVFHMILYPMFHGQGPFSWYSMHMVLFPMFHGHSHFSWDSMHMVLFLEITFSGGGNLLDQDRLVSLIELVGEHTDLRPA